MYQSMLKKHVNNILAKISQAILAKILYTFLRLSAAIRKDMYLD